MGRWGSFCHQCNSCGGGLKPTLSVSAASVRLLLYRWLRRVWRMHVLLLSAEGVQKHLFNLACNWIWPVGVPCSSERWRQMNGGWKEVAGGRRRGERREVAYGQKIRAYGGRTQHCILSHLRGFISTGSIGEWLAVKSIWHMNIAGAILSPPALLNY